jgi:hypothetical protein
VLLVACACGGGKHALDHGELVERAGRICTSQARTIRQIPRGPATPGNAASYLGTVLSVVEDGVNKFRALEPPPQDAAQYRAFLTELDRNTHTLRALRNAAAAEKRREYLFGIQALHRSRRRIDALERSLGFRECSGAG